MPTLTPPFAALFVVLTLARALALLVATLDPLGGFVPTLVVATLEAFEVEIC